MTVNQRKTIRRKADYYDYNLVAVVILLTCFGLMMLQHQRLYGGDALRR